MWKKIAIAGGVGAAVLGAGTAALAMSGQPGPTPTVAAAAPSSARAGRGDASGHRADILKKLRDVQHAEWVTENATTKVVLTHDAIRGAVTTVSSTSISVKSLDGVSQTYVVGSDTKVRVKGATSTISAIKAGDSVVVVGTGTSTLTASQVLVPRR